MDKSLLEQAKAYKTEYSKKKRWQKVVALLCIVVALSTFYALSEPATTMQQEVYCGMEENAEHTHTAQCYSDPEADVENADIWERSFKNAELTGETGHDAAEIAKTQLGYTESTANYLVADNGEMSGYTRYGAWYGESYAEWDVLFAMFCYAGAGTTEDNVPFAADCESLKTELEEAGRFMGTDYVPKVGDLAFFKSETKLCQVGIITGVEIDEDGRLLGIVTVDGDYNNTVAQNERAATDGRILGYGVLDGSEPEAETEVETEAEPTPDPGLKATASKSAVLLGATGTRITNATGFANLRNGGTYYLDADITISNTVTISKNTTLDLNGHKITSTANPLFNINGGSLTITDSNPHDTLVSTTEGNTFGQVASYSNGTLTYYVTKTTVTDPLTGATAETTEKHTATGGMIVGNNDGKRAFTVSGGTLNLNGGYICRFKNNDAGGAVNISGGTVNVNGAVLAANTAANRGGAINLSGSSSVLNIKSGVITGNTANDDGGGAVCASSSATVNMSGGYVTNNYASANDYFKGGGGILLQDKATLNISGGYITSNKATGGGGGIKTWQDWGGNSTGKVIMTGGFVTANNCLNAEGAGMNINAGGALKITAGYITNNILGGGIDDKDFQDWGGGGIFCAENSASSVIMNALVTDNSAGGFGGGVAGCATGRIVTSDKGDGAAIFDNHAVGENTSGSASTKNEDHQYAAESEVFMTHGYQDYFCALASDVSNNMLGGGLEQWEGSSDGIPVSANSENDKIIGGYVTGLTSHASDDDKDAAKNVARVFINGNESPTHGGGILVNGYLVMGTVDNVEVFARLELKPISKQLVDGDGNGIPMTEKAFRFVVADQYGDIVSEGTNDANGQIVFDRMLPFTSDGTYYYTLYELPPEDTAMLYDTSRYNMSVTVYREENNSDKVPWTDIQIVRYKFSNVTITETTNNKSIYNGYPGDEEAHAVEIAATGDNSFVNRKFSDSGGEEGGGGTTLPMSVSVKKEWASGNYQKPNSVNVILKKDGVQVGSAVTLQYNKTASKSWTYTWTGLDPAAEYTVEEVNVNGFISDSDYAYIYATRIDENPNLKNNARLYVKSGNYFVPVANNASLTVGNEYIIASPDGKKLLKISSGHTDAPFSSADTQDVSRDGNNDRYLASDIETNHLDCVFTPKSINRDGYQYTYLEDMGIYSFLLVQNAGGTYLKSTNNNWYSGPMRIYQGKLQGQECPDSWQSGNTWRYIIWDGSKFTSATTLSNVTEEVITGVTKTYTITNTPTAAVTYKLNIKKVDSETSGVLPNTTFELYKDGTRQKFTKANGRYTYTTSNSGSVTSLVTGTDGYIRISDLPAGTYTLRETSPPNGYDLAPDQTFTLGADTPDATLDVIVEDGAVSYVLPETGGSGTFLIYLMGAMLTTVPLTTFVRLYRKSKR